MTSAVMEAMNGFQSARKEPNGDGGPPPAGAVTPPFLPSPPHPPRVGRGATRPPQTLGDSGAVKPGTCPCPCTHAHTTVFSLWGSKWVKNRLCRSRCPHAGLGIRGHSWGRRPPTGFVGCDRPLSVRLASPSGLSARTPGTACIVRSSKM